MNKVLTFIVVFLSVLSATAQSHTIPTLDSNNTWTNVNTFANGNLVLTGGGACTPGSFMTGYTNAFSPICQVGTVAAGVSSVNSAAGSITLAGGTNISIAQSPAGTFTINSTGSAGGVTSVNTLQGALTFSVANGITLTPTSSTNLQIGTTLTQGVASLNGLNGVLTLTAGTGISLTSTSGTNITIANTGGGGGSGVTSVGMTVPSWLSVSGSPITTTGTLAITSASAAANLVLATPNGSSGVLSARALVPTDIPTLAYLTGLSGDVTASAGGVGGVVAANVVSVGGGATFASQITGPICNTTGTGALGPCASISVPSFLSAATYSESGVYIVPCTNTPVFDLSQGDVQILTLTTGCTAVTSSSIINAPASGKARKVMFIIQQDATGGRPFPNPTWANSWTPVQLVANGSTATLLTFTNLAGSPSNIADNANSQFCAVSGSSGSLACGNARSGFFAIPGGSSVSVTISTTAVTANSVIVPTNDTSIGASVTPTVTCGTTAVGLPQITHTTGSFTITFPGTTSGNICGGFIVGNQ